MKPLPLIDDDIDINEIYKLENIIEEENRLKKEKNILDDVTDKQKNDYIAEIKNTNIFSDIEKIKKKNSGFLVKLRKTLFGF